MAKGTASDPNTTALLAEGEAALWLSESLIIALLETGLLSQDAIFDAIENVVAAKKLEAEQGNHPEVARAAAAILAAVAASLAAAAVPPGPEDGAGQAGTGFD